MNTIDEIIMPLTLAARNIDTSETQKIKLDDTHKMRPIKQRTTHKMPSGSQWTAWLMLAALAGALVGLVSSFPSGGSAAPQVVVTTTPGPTVTITTRPANTPAATHRFVYIKPSVPHMMHKAQTPAATKTSTPVPSVTPTGTPAITPSASSAGSSSATPPIIGPTPTSPTPTIS